MPAGVLSALELAFGAVAIRPSACGPGCPTTYPACRSPRPAPRLIDGLAALAGLSIDSGSLRNAADSSRRQVDQLIADNSEHQAMVRKLEENIDASEGNAMGVEEVPSGDEIAAELEKFLRGEDQ